MKEGPDIARLGSLVGDPGRANMLVALMSGKALTVSELANEAGVTLPTASAHLAKLDSGGLVSQRKQGRHRYFSLADGDVAYALETMMGLAARKGHTRTRTGPKDPALRKARVCYNHLAGEFGVRMFDTLVMDGHVVSHDERIELTDSGRTFVREFGIELEALEKSRRPLCKSCLDWSVRRTHLAGSLGAAFLNRFRELGWAERLAGSRIVEFSTSGEKQFLRRFPACPEVD